MSDPTPLVQAVFGIASGLQLIGGIGVSWILWRHRSLPALKIRNVPLVLAQLWSMTICMLAYGSKYLFLSSNCFWQAMFTFVPLMSFVASMTVRCYLLNLVFSASVEGAKLAEKLGNAKGIDASEKLKRLKKLYQPHIVLVIFAIEAVAISLPFLVALFRQTSIGDLSGSTNDLVCEEVYGSETLSPVIYTLIVGACILLFFYVRLRHVRENFNIKTEITAFIVLFVVIAVSLGFFEISGVVPETGAWALIRLIYFVEAWMGTTIALNYAIPEECWLPWKRSSIAEKPSNTSTATKPSSLETLIKEMESIFLNTDDGFEVFKDFLVKEFSSENAFFYKQCKIFADSCSTMNQEQRRSAGMMIMNNFISDDAPLCINVSFLCRKNTLLGPADDPSTFDPAVHEIVDLMVKDSFKRFRLSEEYNRFFDERSKTIVEIVESI
jgi:hypothetical protein